MSSSAETAAGVGADSVAAEETRGAAAVTRVTIGIETMIIAAEGASAVAEVDPAPHPDIATREIAVLLEEAVGIVTYRAEARH